MLVRKLPLPQGLHFFNRFLLQSSRDRTAQAMVEQDDPVLLINRSDIRQVDDKCPVAPKETLIILCDFIHFSVKFERSGFRNQSYFMCDFHRLKI